MRLLTSMLLAAILFLQNSCTKQDIVDTGLAKATFDGTVLDYLKSDPYNWRLTVEMIERAEMAELFDGNVDSLKEITFFGPTSYSILRHLYDNNLERVDQLSPEFCRSTIRQHVVKGKILKKDIPFRDRQYYVFDPEQPAENYLEVYTVGQNRLRLYLERTAYEAIPDAGPIAMYAYSMTANTFIPLASPDIQPANGVVHSLNYNFKLNNL